MLVILKFDKVMKCTGGPPLYSHIRLYKIIEHSILIFTDIDSLLYLNVAISHVSYHLTLTLLSFTV